MLQLVEFSGAGIPRGPLRRYFAALPAEARRKRSIGRLCHATYFVLPLLSQNQVRVRLDLTDHALSMITLESS